MKLKNILKFLNESTDLVTSGKKLKSDGWTIKISNYYPTIRIKSPSGKETEILDYEAEEIIEYIPKDISAKEESDFVLGYLYSKKMLSEQHLMLEGVYDPSIFKAVFIAGGPGSGKGYVVNKLFGLNNMVKFSSTGLKLINSDIAFERFLKINQFSPKDLDAMFKNDPEEYETKIGSGREKAKQITDYMQDKFIENKLGILIDGTGKNAEKIKKQKDALENIGYDCLLIFVNTSLETAKKRNQSRERVVPEPVVVKSWNEVQNNIGKFQSMFRNKMVIIDNNDNSVIDSNIIKTINKFINEPPRNPIARDWISNELKRKNRN